MPSSGDRPREPTRRRLLAAVGAAGAALTAGCGAFGPGGDGDGSSPTATDASTPTPTPTPTATATPTPTETETRPATSATESTATPSGTASGGGGGTRRLAVGETFAAPTGIRATVERVAVRESGEGINRTPPNRTAPGDQPRPVRVPEGQQAVAVEFDATNAGDAPANAPDPSAITVRAGGRTFRPIGVGQIPQGYTGGSLDPGASASGWLLYLLPETVPRSSVSVAWSGREAGRAWTAVWTTRS